MSSKKYSLAAVALLAAPFATQAGTSPDMAFEACVKAFVQTYLPDRVVHTPKRPDFVGSPFSYTWQPRSYTIALSARGVKSGDVVAEARCIANASGLVLVLDTPPTKDYVARADFVATLR